MKLFDLRLRGSGFTLATVVNDNDHDRFRDLIAYWQDNTKDKNSEVPVTFELLPTDYYPIAFCEIVSAWLIKEGYATKEGTHHTLTKKTLDVFEKTIEKEKELTESGFSCRPCCCPCCDID